MAEGLEKTGELTSSKIKLDSSRAFARRTRLKGILPSASNEAKRQPFLNLQIARTYLMGADSKDGHADMAGSHGEGRPSQTGADPAMLEGCDL
jgi:hypothetical protein